MMQEVNRESAFEVLQQKAADAAAVAQQVEEQGEEEVRKQPRLSESLWGKDWQGSRGCRRCFGRNHDCASDDRTQIQRVAGKKRGRRYCRNIGH